MDFQDDPTLGGGIDIEWDPNVLALRAFDYTIVGDPTFFAPRIIEITEGSIDGFGFGDFSGIPGPEFLGTLIFDILVALPGSHPPTTVVLTDDSDGVVGPFISAVTFLPQEADFVNATVVFAPVPIPAALWLMAAAIGSLCGFRRLRPRAIPGPESCDRPELADLRLPVFRNPAPTGAQVNVASPD